MSVAIRTEHLSKEYRLGLINHGMLYKDLQSWIARRLGRPDPHTKIGKERYEDQVDRFWALKDLVFDVEEGDRVGVVGKNGAGKSTLLKILSRITAPTEGTVKIRGRVASLLEIGTGFHAELTGRENIFLNGAILGMNKRDIAQKLDAIIDFSGIDAHIDTPVKRYSSGMYVRLAFAVIAHLDSEILIADEVLAVGDLNFQKKALLKMQDISAGQGRTILFVSHNMGSVAALCNKGMFLDHGKLIANGELGEALRLYSNDSRYALSDWTGDVGDDNLRLKKVQLKGAHDILSTGNTFEKGEKLILSMVFEILIARQNFVFSVEVFNNKGSLLCVNSVADSASEMDYLKLTELGTHLLQLTMDTSIFAPGDYYIKLDFAIHNVTRIINDEPVISFRISKDKSGRQESDLRMNAISPDWKWTER